MGLKKDAIDGVVWTFIQQFSVQIINFAVQIVLARLLMPEAFGLIAMLTVFIAIGQTLMDSGMTTSIIRTRDPDQLDYSTVFVTNLIISFGVYCLVFLCAPFIASFYEQPILSNILRVYSLTFVIKSLVAVHIAKLTKEMNFKLQMKLQIPSTLVGAVVGIFMALNEYGVWSMVWLNLSQTIVFTIQNWIFINWRPSLKFNKRRFKYHFSFGYKMTLSSLLDTIYTNSYNIVIGKFFSPTIVGFYNQADTMRLFPVAQLSNVLGKVTYPLFANLKNNEQLKDVYRVSVQLVLLIIIPSMIFLIIIAEPLFLFLFGERWLPAVSYFQILSVASIVRPIGTYNLNILKVKGRSDLFLKLEIVKKVIGIGSIIIALPFGITALVVSLAITSFLFAFLNAWFCGKLINYSLREQVNDIMSLFIIGSSVGCIVYFILPFIVGISDDNFNVILMSAATYALLYLSAIYLLNKEMVMVFKRIIKK